MAHFPSRQIKRSRVLSISQKNESAENIIEDYSNKWGCPFSQAVFRIAREYDQMSRPSITKHLNLDTNYDETRNKERLFTTR